MTLRSMSVPILTTLLLCTASLAHGLEVSARGTPGKFAASPEPAVELNRLGLLPQELRHAELTPGAVLRVDGGGEVHRIRQTLGGIPVEGTSLIVRTDADGVARWIGGSALAPSWTPDTEPTLSPADARQLGRAYTQQPIDESIPAHLVFRDTLGEPVLAYRMDLPMIPGAFDAPTIWIDAQTGAMLARVNRIRFARANVYEPNPVSGRLVQDELEELIPPEEGGVQHLTGNWVVAMNCVDQGDRLAYYNVAVCTDMHVAQPTDAEGNFFYEPVVDQSSAEAATDNFAEVQAYYHVAKAYKYFRDLGLKTVNASPLEAVVNYRVAWTSRGGLRPYDNAAYVPAGYGLLGEREDMIVFGQGTDVDYAYDGDVFYHEFTHAAVGATSDLAYPYMGQNTYITDPGAMNEAFADYFSSAIRNEPTVGLYALGSQNRDLSVRATCPENLYGEVHEDSPIWSSTLWEIRELLDDTYSKKAVDQAIYDGMISMPSTANYKSAVDAMLAAIQLRLGSDAKAQAKEVFTSHGLPDCGERVRDLTEINFEAEQLIFDAATSALPKVPSPVQYRLHDAFAYKSITVSVDWLVPHDSETPEISVALGTKGTPITLSGNYSGKVSGDWTKLATLQNQQVTLDIPEDAGTIHLLFLNSGGMASIKGISFQPTLRDPVSSGGGDSGCSVGGAGALSALFALAVGLGMRRRKA